MSLGPIVCDACVVLNLVATGQETRLLRALGATVLMGPQARAEAQFLYGPPDESGIRTLFPADLRPLEAGGLLQVQPHGTSTPLHGEYLRCTALTSLADAECMALARVLGLPLATDDRRQRRLFSKLYGGRLLTTLELLSDAAAKLGLPENEVRAVLADVFCKGRFAPPGNESGLPLGEWYRGHLEAAGLL